MSAHASPTAVGMTPALTLLFAMTGGAVVGNLYWGGQPLLPSIASSFDVSTAAARLLLTVTQVSYAIGVLLVVPLGDTFAPRPRRQPNLPQPHRLRCMAA